MVVVTIGVTVAPVPVFLLLVFVQLAIVAMRFAVGFDDPLVVVDAFVVVPAMIVVEIGVVGAVAMFGATGGEERDEEGCGQEQKASASRKVHVPVLLACVSENRHAHPDNAV